MTDDTGCDDDKIWRDVPVSALRAALAPAMTDVETVALREELARTVCRRFYGDELDWLEFVDEADAILPIIARECAAAISAATPLIEARVREECAKVADEHDDAPESDYGYGWRNASQSIAEAIRKG
jgi:hypothetical protein